MHERETIETQLARLGESDPRIGEEYLRVVESDEFAPVVLVGVVHDHPASVHRVRRIVESLDPEVLGLELPPISTPLFEQFASDEIRPDECAPVPGALPDGGDVGPDGPSADDRSGETDGTGGPAGHVVGDRDDLVAGGEMAAAIRAANEPRVVGLDMPDGRSLTKLLATMWRERVSVGTARDVLADVRRLCRHAVDGRLAAAGVPHSMIRTDLDRRRRYEVSVADPPVVQADHEHSHVRRSRALLRSLDPPIATRLVDDVRERHIGARLVTVRTETTEPVVVVVGYDHLDRIASLLRTSSV